MATTFRIHEDQENLKKYGYNKDATNIFRQPFNTKTEKVCEVREILKPMTNQCSRSQVNENTSDPKINQILQHINRKALTEIQEYNLRQSVTCGVAPAPDNANCDRDPARSRNQIDSEDRMLVEISTEQDVSMKDQEDDELMSMSQYTDVSRTEDFTYDPLMLEYRDDIFQNLRRAERHHRAHPLYMRRQPELTEQMRAILVDWLVSVSEEYKLNGETLSLAVSYIDRFLSKMSVVRGKLQLVGVTAMLIAGKFEEIYPPDVSEYVYLTNDAYTLGQLLRMEQLMLRALTFDLALPTAHTFIQEYLAHTDSDDTIHKLAMYLNELTIVENCLCLQHLPSKVAAASVALARHTMHDKQIWPKKLENLSGYTLKELTPVISHQHKIFEESPTNALQAVNVKYSSKKFSRVSRFRPRILNLDIEES